MNKDQIFVRVNIENNKIAGFWSGGAGPDGPMSDHPDYCLSSYLKDLKIGDQFPLAKNNYLLKLEGIPVEGNDQKLPEAERITESNKAMNSRLHHEDGREIIKRVIAIPLKMITLINPSWGAFQQTVEDICKVYLGDNNLVLNDTLNYNVDAKTGHGEEAALSSVVIKEEGFDENEYKRITCNSLPMKQSNINGGIVCMYNDKVHIFPRIDNVNMIKFKGASKDAILVRSVLVENNIVVRVKGQTDLHPNRKDILDNLSDILITPKEQEIINKKNVTAMWKRNEPQFDPDDDEPKKKKGMRM